MSAELTLPQLAVLRSTDRSWRTRANLLGRARDHHGWGRSADGFDATLSALARAGLLEVSYFSGREHWQITDAGRAAEVAAQVTS